jgi:hypothetical protein
MFLISFSISLVKILVPDQVLIEFHLEQNFSRFLKTTCCEGDGEERRLPTSPGLRKTRPYFFDISDELLDRFGISLTNRCTA